MKRFGWKSVAVPLALLAAYVLAWSPLRAWSAVHVFGPLLAAAADGWAVRAHAAPPGVTLQRAAEAHAYSVPLGRAFLLPALALAAVAPTRPFWAWLAGVLLAVGALSLALALAGVRGVPGAWSLQAFVDGYVTVPLSVGLPLLWLRAARAEPGVGP